MRRSSRCLFLVLALVFFLGPAPSSAFENSPQAPAQEEHATASEHNSKEGGGSHEASPIYRWINFAILVAGLGFVLRKPLAQFFAERTASIRKELEDGRSALSASEEKLRAVEQKLQRFEQEMADFRAAALKEMEEEHARMRQTTEQEAAKIMESVRVQMDVAGKQARLELRLYAAEQAVSLAEKVIAGRMDETRQKRLVGQFVEKLGAESKPS